ncbi:MAG TPA: ribonuclease R [bacterium]|nr:ribonuclease R [bacterium]
MPKKHHSRKPKKENHPKGHFQGGSRSGRRHGPSSKQGKGGSHPDPGARELVGKVQANEKGFGFFVPEDGSPDAFVPPREMRGILNGDTVLARVGKDSFKEGKFSATVVSIVKRAHEDLVGTLIKEQGRFLLKPDDFRVAQPLILIPGPLKGQAGQKAVAKITKWPGDGPMEGHLVEILGFPDDPGVDIKSVIRKYQWPDTFPKPVESQVAGLPENPGPGDWEGRLDLRDMPVMTIDGADAKDFDDAISLEINSIGNYQLGVHIADVSHYVREGTPLNEEAQDRGTSLYLADRVLPMLPYSLSDGLCSLRAGVPRLTLSAFLTYSPKGEFIKAGFAQSVIQSRCRGVYEEVQQFLDGTGSPEINAKYAPFKQVLADMVKLSRWIRKKRDASGSLDFDFPEVRAVIQNGKVVDVRKKERLETHKLIEDFMVAANEAVATHLENSKVPAIYRIHEPPNDSDVEELITFLGAYHIPFKGLDFTTPIGLQSLLKSVKGGPYDAVVSNLALRSLKLAVYSTRNAGHFGLALKSYCHFTSPIRRFPDLMVHRALKKVLQKDRALAQAKPLEKIALHSSEQERIAEKAERESQKILQLRFMENKINQIFEGPVRHLTPYGAFVELNPYGVEGFVPLENLKDDDYQLDAPSLVLRGKRGSKIQLGDQLKVQVLAVDMVFQRLMLTRVYA